MCCNGNMRALTLNKVFVNKLEKEFSLGADTININVCEANVMLPRYYY